LELTVVDEFIEESSVQVEPPVPNTDDINSNRNKDDVEDADPIMNSEQECIINDSENATNGTDKVENNIVETASRNCHIDKMYEEDISTDELSLKLEIKEESEDEEIDSKFGLNLSDFKENHSQSSHGLTIDKESGIACVTVSSNAETSDSNLDLSVATPDKENCVDYSNDIQTPNKQNLPELKKSLDVAEKSQFIEDLQEKCVSLENNCQYNVIRKSVDSPSMTLSPSHDVINTKSGMSASIKRNKNSSKRTKFEDDMEPPPLKIRIFKGNSGELINEKEARRSKKRKKQTQKDKEKVKKIATEKAVSGISKVSEVDESTQNRILQELPGCNWLENKIKRREDPIEQPKPSENNVGNQLDALLESDSDEDYLVVDDQTENCEITTSSKPEDADVEQPLNKNPPQTAENNSPQNNNPGTIMNTSPDAKCEEVGEAQGSHTFTYMLGNLMKKLDKSTANGGLNCTLNQSDDKNQKIDECSSLAIKCKKDQAINGVSETDEIIEIPNPKGTLHNACQDVGSTNSLEDPRKQNVNNGWSHTIPVPKVISKEISDHQNIAKEI